MEPRYCYSTDEETYHGDFATRDEAAEFAFKECEADQETVWTAEIEKPHFTACLPDGDDLAEQAIERMNERAREHWEDSDWPDVDKGDEAKLAEALDAAVKAWADQHLPAVDFFTCENVKPHTRKAAPRG